MIYQNNNSDKIHQIQQSLIKNNKVLLILNCLNGLIALTGSILGIISSKHIQDLQIETSLQTAIIVFASLIIIISLINSVIWFYYKSKKWQRITIAILLMISLGSIIGMVVANILVTRFSSFCGIYIQHDYPYDGFDIKSSLNRAINSCSELENTGLPTEEVVRQLSIVYIIQSCKTFDFEQGVNCLSLDSLVVENWSSLYTNQIVSLVLLGLYYLFNIVFTILIERKLKEITIQYPPLLKNNF
ncbi:hypothetical protein ABPG72_020294 [Tetrahymena utriculariae]